MDGSDEDRYGAESLPHRNRQAQVMTKSPTVKSLQAYHLIRELILQGELLPGTRLVLADLEARLGVGRGPIREALMRLDRSGLIENLPYKGAVVAPLPGVREIEYMYEVRVRLECLLAAEAMHHAEKADLDTLEERLRDMADGCGMTILQADRNFHGALYRPARMPHLLNTASSLVDHAEIFLNSRCGCGVQDQDMLVRQHGDILRAFCDRDAAALCEALRRNILHGLALIRREMERRGRPDW